MKHSKQFLSDTRFSPQFLFVGFSASNKEQAISAKIKNSTFVGWDDLSLLNGELLANKIPVKYYRMIIVGSIGENVNMYSCLQLCIAQHGLKTLQYGVPPERENKMFQTAKMNQAGIKQIKTVIIKANAISAHELGRELKWPIVSKIINGSQGKGIVKHDTKVGLQAFLEKNKDEFFIFQEFIPNDCDYRSFYLNKDLVYTIKRKATDSKEFRNNVSLGGTQEFFDLPAEAQSLADQIVEVMKFDITGVDLIQNSKTKEWYVMEINAAPQFTGPEFDMVIDAIVNHISKEYL